MRISFILRFSGCGTRVNGKISLHLQKFLHQINMKVLTIFLLAAAATLNLNAATKFNVDRIDPPHWWTGMKGSQLQLQVYGPDVRGTEVSISYPGVTLDSVVRLDGSANWQHLYLTISPDAKPGKIPIVWRDGKRSITRRYELRERTRKGGAAGFDAADVLYLVMPDRFADADPSNNLIKEMNFPVGADRADLNARHGGDLAGIARHIGYLDSLGVTAIWLNPVLENDMPKGSYHGYATTDYYAVDRRLGTNAEYAALTDSLRAHGMKTVMDMIFNHCGSEHPWMKDRPSSDWFNFSEGFRQTNHRLSTVSDPYASDYDRKLTTDGWFVEEMPDLNQRNPHLLKYLIQNSIWWIEETGIDGIRMDTYPYADKDAMAQWIDDVLYEYPDFNIVGECWFAQPGMEAYWQKGSPLSATDSRLPTIMDFSFAIMNAKLAPFNEETDPWNGLNKIYNHLALDFIYPDAQKLLRFLDNHDTDRFITEAPKDLAKWKQAVTLLLTLPGIPQMYYGTELLMHGDRTQGDGAIRLDIPGGFPGDTVNSFLPSGRTDLQNEAFDFLSKLLKWRRANPQSMKGGMKHFVPDNGLYVFRRGEGENQAIVLLNGVDTDNCVDMGRYEEIAAKGQRFRDILTGETIELIPEDSHKHFQPREIRILTPL